MNLGPCAICRKNISFNQEEKAGIKKNISGNNAEIWQISKNRNFFHIDCNNCKSSIFAMSLVCPYPFTGQIFSMVIQTPTDLIKEDLIKITNNNQISADEALDIIKNLK